MPVKKGKARIAPRLAPMMKPDVPSSGVDRYFKSISFFVLTKLPAVSL